MMAVLHPFIEECEMRVVRRERLKIGAVSGWVFAFLSCACGDQRVMGKLGRWMREGWEFEV